jgi:hypothetical protein
MLAPRRRLFQCRHSGECAVIPIIAVDAVVAVGEQLAAIDREQPGSGIAGDGGVASHDGGGAATGHKAVKISRHFSLVDDQQDVRACGARRNAVFAVVCVPEPVKFTLAPIPLHGTLFVSSMPSKSNPLRITVTEVPLMVMKETPPSSELLPMLLSQLTVSDLLIPRPPKLPESAQVISPPVVVLLYAPLKLAHGVGRSQLLASLPLDATQV